MGREETIDYCVPISRLKQHRQEVARLLPGLKRTDEPVFNVPRLGKSRPGARQDHVVIITLPDGRCVYLRLRPHPRFFQLQGRPAYKNTRAQAVGRAGGAAG